MLRVNHGDDRVEPVKRRDVVVDVVALGHRLVDVERLRDRVGAGHAAGLDHYPIEPLLASPEVFENFDEVGAPSFWDGFPSILQPVLSTGIAAGGISAFVLNLVLNVWGAKTEADASDDTDALPPAMEARADADEGTVDAASSS